MKENKFLGKWRFYGIHQNNNVKAGDRATKQHQCRSHTSQHNTRLNAYFNTILLDYLLYVISPADLSDGIKRSWKSCPKRYQSEICEWLRPSIFHSNYMPQPWCDKPNVFNLSFLSITPALCMWGTKWIKSQECHTRKTWLKGSYTITGWVGYEEQKAPWSHVKHKMMEELVTIGKLCTSIQIQLFSPSCLWVKSWC